LLVLTLLLLQFTYPLDSKREIKFKYTQLREQFGYPPTAAEFYSYGGTSRGELKKLFGSDPYSKLQKACGDIPNTTKRQKEYKLRIFLAEDNPADSELFKRAFSQTGVVGDVIVAEDGEHLMQLLSSKRRGPPDLIFLDINMPRKDGKQCLREIRRHEKYSGVPVIMFTNSALENEINDTYAKGANLYITKPFGFEEQVKTLKKIFKTNWKKIRPQPERRKFVVGKAV